MVIEQRNEYEPDYVSPPGESLVEILKSKSMAQSELAKRAGRTSKLINEIIKGKAVITPETAIQFERVLAIPASFWNNRQRRYDEFIALQEEIERLKSGLEWSRFFPYKAMARLHWVPDCTDRIERLKNLLNFFGVASPQSGAQLLENQQVAYRKSETHQPDQYALAAWLRCGEQMATEIDCEIYDEKNFYQCLNKMRALTTLSPNEFQPKLIEDCAQSGVAVVFVPELPRTASGATRWLSPDKALLQLSLKYKTNDHLWFTFFHEAAHILRHQKKKIFIESGSCEGKEETEANSFAEGFLIPPAELKNFAMATPLSKKNIRLFAERLGIAPGIVVGQLQNKKHLPWDRCNDLKMKLRWVNDIR